MVSAAAGGAARGVISIEARLRAIERFRQLSAAIRASDNRMVQLGLRTVSLAGRLTLLSTAVSILSHPVSGLLVLLQAGLATRSWLLFERESRRATFQLRLMGLETARANQIVSEFRAQLGTAAARELFQSTRALVGLAGAGRGWRETLADTLKDMKDAGLDFVTFAEIVGDTLTGENSPEEGFKRLQDLFPGLIGDADNFNEAVGNIQTAVSEFDFTNMEDANRTLGEMRDRSDTLIGQLNEALAVVPKLATITVAGTINLTLDIVSGFQEGGLILIKSAFEPLADSAISIFTGKFDDIPGIWDKWWADNKQKFIDNIKPIVTFIGAAIGLAMFSPLGIGVAITGALLGRFLEDLTQDEDLTESATLLGAAIGGTIGLALGGPLGPAIGAALGAAIGALVSIVIENREAIVAAGNQIGNAIVDGIAEAFSFFTENPFDLMRRLFKALPNIPNFDLSAPGIPGSSAGPSLRGSTGALASASPIVIPVYIGTEHVDTVVVNALTRVSRFQSGIMPKSVISS